MRRWIFQPSIASPDSASALPGEDVGVDGVYERSIEIENECAHAWLGPSLIRHRELTPATHRRTLAQTSGLTT